MRFFRTPKGILLLILIVFVGAAAPAEGWGVVLPGLCLAVGASAAIDAIILRVRHRKWELPSGAILTALIVAMVLTSREPWWVVVATSVVGVVSKYILRAGGANIFNPAALGLVATFYVFGTGQSWWGALPELPVAALAVLVAAGVFMTDRVNKIPAVIAFLGAYYLGFTVMAFVGRAPHVFEVFRAPDLHAALYFAFFILTDPPTSPTRHPDQLVYGAIAGLVAWAVFMTVGAAFYLLAGVLAANLFEAVRRWVARRRRAASRRLVTVP